MVQFLKDPVFNTSLIVGYYWIPLTILIVLYSFIFHSAWTLSKKAADKERERQKLLATLAKKPGSDGTPPQITKKATNTALGIAAMAASFAPNSASNPQQSTSATSKENVEAPFQTSTDEATSNNTGIKKPSLLPPPPAGLENADQEQLPCTCSKEIVKRPPPTESACQKRQHGTYTTYIYLSNLLHLITHP